MTRTQATPISAFALLGHSRRRGEECAAQLSNVKCLTCATMRRGYDSARQTNSLESTMTDLTHASNASTSTPSYDLSLIAVFATIAIAVCLVIAIYSDAANIIPADPVLSSFYP
jgi:hypothetical protein